MPSPNATFTELVTTTFRKHRSKLYDNVTKHNALLRYLKKGGRMETEDGGLTLVYPLEYDENVTYQRYSGFDTLNTAQSDVFTAAEYQWKQIALNVVSSGRELRINSGDSQIIKLAKSRLTNAMNTFQNQFTVDLYSSGSLTNQIGGLQHLVSDDGTGTVGGIVAGTYTFWKNTFQSAAAPLQGGGGVTVSDTTIENDMMLPLYMRLTRGNDSPNVGIFSDDYYRFFEKSQVSFKQYVNTSDADAGMQNLKYKGMTCFFEGNSIIPAAHAYFLNTNYIKLVAHSAANLTVQDQMTPYNQDGVIVPILWMGNMICSNRALQGVMKA
jgi:hypothetical protein